MKKILLIIYLFLFGITSVYADNLFKTAEIKYEEDNPKNLFMYFGDANITSSNYYIYYSESLLNFTDNLEPKTIDSDKIKSGTNTFSINNNRTSSLSSIFELNKDTFYFYVLEYKDATYYINTSDVIVIKRDDIDKLENEINQQLNVYFSEDTVSTTIYAPKGITTKRKLKYKIGRMTDYAILKKLYNKNYEGIKDLINYAKNDSNGITDTIDAELINYKISDKINIQDKAYYYGYYELEDENGKYYPVTDIDLLQGYTSFLGKMFLSYNDSKFEYIFEDELKEEPVEVDERIKGTVENKKTGVKEYVLTFLMISSLAFIILKSIKNNNLFKKI